MRVLNLLLCASTVAGNAIRGYNSGGTLPNGAIKYADDFRKEMKRLHTLPGTHGSFTSLRLFSTIQAGTDHDPVEAFQPALETGTKLLLGMWASAGQDAFDKELVALKTAIRQHPKKWHDIVYGICVGSEDLYRISTTGIENKEKAGASPETLVHYIHQVRQVLRGTPAQGTHICHVDTWNAWVNGSNSAVIDAIDWLGHDGYPYFEKDTHRNYIRNAKELFYEALHKTQSVAKGKPVKITETGWPIAGEAYKFGHSVPSLKNARRYWKDVGCSAFGRHDIWWYGLDDHHDDPNALSFSTIGPNWGAPLFDLSCPRRK